MKTTTSYTSTLPVELIRQLNELSLRLKIPKNKIIEVSLRKHLEEMKRQEFANGFKRAAADEEIGQMVEEGMSEYLALIDRL
jgi:predicted DNA-binding protein